MNRLAKAFDGQKALIAFITGGDPDMETTEQLILAMAEAGADVIEIGIPFSDPVAEGAVIQAADMRALAGGCTTDTLFDMVKRVRPKTDVPLLFMTYINPVYSYGKGRFLANCAACGMDGLIVPDLPFEEKDELAGECEKRAIPLISFIAPTSGDRARTIAREAEGFLYCVSSLGVTGVRGEIGTDISRLIAEVREASSIPCAIGFGISTPGQARDMAKLSDGVIVGSAIVKIVAEHGKNCIPHVKRFIGGMKESIS